jgi:hypothetical protein
MRYQWSRKMIDYVFVDLTRRVIYSYKENDCLRSLADIQRKHFSANARE